jgi:hypothetical protein
MAVRVELAKRKMTASKLKIHAQALAVVPIQSSALLIVNKILFDILAP